MKSEFRSSVPLPCVKKLHFPRVKGAKPSFCWLGEPQNLKYSARVARDKVQSSFAASELQGALFSWLPSTTNLVSKAWLPSQSLKSRACCSLPYLDATLKAFVKAMADKSRARGEVTSVDKDVALSS